MAFNDAVLLFTIYAFAGWVIESVFVSFLEKKAVNRGFLHGCVCPVYGFGGLLIIFSSGYVKAYLPEGLAGIIVNAAICMLIVTVLEFATGYLLEKFFHCKWWDYSNDFANIHGYICLKNSLIWGILAMLLVEAANPFLLGKLGLLAEEYKFYASVIILAYFLFDTAISLIETLNLRNVILKYANIPINKYNELIIRYRRFFHAFPHLLKLNAGIINRDVRSILNERIKKVKEDIKNIRQQL